MSENDMSDNDLPSKDLVGEQEVTDDSSGIPVLPLRDVVVYPHMVIPLFVGRDKSIVALDNTRVLDGNMVRVLSWYDNEWGFSNRMLDTAAAIGKLG